MTEERFRQSEELRRIREAQANAVKAGRLENPIETLTESQAIASEVYGLIKPLVEAKRKQMVLEQELQTDINQLTQQLNTISIALQEATRKMTELIQTRSANAEKESKMLDKLMNAL